MGGDGTSWAGLVSNGGQFRWLYSQNLHRDLDMDWTSRGARRFPRIDLFRFGFRGERFIRLPILCAIVGAIFAAPGWANTSSKKIAFSNNYAGNSWRQAMLKDYSAVSKKAVA